MGLYHQGEDIREWRCLLGVYPPWAGGGKAVDTCWQTAGPHNCKEWSLTHKKISHNWASKKNTANSGPQHNLGNTKTQRRKTSLVHPWKRPRPFLIPLNAHWRCVELDSEPGTLLFHRRVSHAVRTISLESLLPSSTGNLQKSKHKIFLYPLTLPTHCC